LVEGRTPTDVKVLSHPRAVPWTDREVVEKYIVEACGTHYVRGFTCPIKMSVSRAVLALAIEVGVALV